MSFLPSFRGAFRRQFAFLLVAVALFVAPACSRTNADGGIESKVDSDGPQGLFFMTKYWIATRSLEKAVWYFAPDGRIFKDLAHGVTSVDLSAHQGPSGSYKLIGNQLEATWSDGKKSASTFEHKKGDVGFAWDTGLFAPMKPFTNAAAVVGSYEGGESVGGGGNLVIVARSLELRADGSFTSTGISSAKSTSSGTQFSGGGQSAEKGKWSLAGLSITLTGEDGVARRMIAFPFDDEATPIYPDRMFLGGMMYKRR
jgi:hypothetical protein